MKKSKQSYEQITNTICESCRVDVHIQDVVSIVETGELFCFTCKDEYEIENV